MNRPVFRFAPSPNGHLHLGHAYSALLNFELARRLGGRLLLRIEDIDAARSRPEFEEAIHRDLAWLGIGYETPVRRQSEHFPAYAEALRRLEEAGLVYPAFLSRTEIAARTGQSGWPRDPDGAPLYPGDDRDLGPAEREARIASGDAFALRLRAAEAIARVGPLAFEATDLDDFGTLRSVVADAARWGDFIVARKEVPTSYALAVVLDDALQGVTHVVRGADLEPATSAQRLLQTLLKLPPPIYLHHRLVVDPDGRKLSKSAGDTAIAALRDRGASPAEIRQLTGIDEDLAAFRPAGA